MHAAICAFCAGVTFEAPKPLSLTGKPASNRHFSFMDAALAEDETIGISMTAAAAIMNARMFSSSGRESSHTKDRPPRYRESMRAAGLFF
jgi:hypothetical protein